MLQDGQIKKKKKKKKEKCRWLRILRGFPDEAFLSGLKGTKVSMSRGVLEAFLSLQERRLRESYAV
jgi:hypothetical protein